MKYSLRYLFKQADYDMKNLYCKRFKAFMEKIYFPVAIFDLQLVQKRLKEFIVWTLNEKRDFYIKKLFASELDPTMKDFNIILTKLTQLERNDAKLITND